MLAQGEALVKARSSVSEAKALWQEAVQTRLRPPDPVQQAVSGWLKALLEAAVAALEQEHAALRSREATNTKMLTARYVLGAPGTHRLICIVLVLVPSCVYCCRFDMLSHLDQQDTSSAV